MADTNQYTDPNEAGDPDSVTPKQHKAMKKGKEQSRRQLEVQVWSDMVSLSGYVAVASIS